MHAPAESDDRPHGGRTLVVSVLGKGGSGKSSTTACLGDALQRHAGWSVALVDLDSQPSLTQWLTSGVRNTLVEALVPGGPGVDDVALDLRPGLRLLPAHDGLADLGVGELNAGVLREVFAELDRPGAGGAAVAVIDTPAWQPITSDTTLLRAAVDVADVVVVPFNVGRKGVRAMVGVLADLAVGVGITGREVPVLLLPANVDRPGEVEAAVELARWLRPDLTFAPSVPHVATAMRRAEDRGRLLADDSPRSPAVLQYRAAAEVLADTLRRIGAGEGA